MSQGGVNDESSDLEHGLQLLDVGASRPDQQVKVVGVHLDRALGEVAVQSRAVALGRRASQARASHAWMRTCSP